MKSLKKSVSNTFICRSGFCIRTRQSVGQSYSIRKPCFYNLPVGHLILSLRVMFEVGLVACIWICRDTFSSSGSFLYDNFIKRNPNFVQLVVYLSYTKTLQWITTLSVNTICAFPMVLPGTYICRSLILLNIPSLDIIMFLLSESVLRSGETII